jgi:hypothetical protein
MIDSAVHQIPGGPQATLHKGSLWQREAAALLSPPSAGLVVEAYGTRNCPEVRIQGIGHPDDSHWPASVFDSREQGIEG